MMRNTLMIAVVAGAVSIGTVAGCNNEITGLGPPSDPATETFAASLNVDLSQMTKMPNGVYYQDLVVGTGDLVTEQSDTIFVDYAGYFKDGRLFDSGSNARLVPAQLVPGFRTGVVGMKVGGQRQLVIPSALGYGSNSVRDPATNKIKIPRQSTLVFTVGLIRVHTPVPAT